MKAIMVYQPDASLIVGGFKRTLIRDELTDHRGQVVLCVPRNLHANAEYIKTYREPWRNCLREVGVWSIDDYPVGCAVGTAEIEDVLATDHADLCSLPDLERELDDFCPGCYCYLLARVRRFAVPVVIPSRTGVFNLPSALALPPSEFVVPRRRAKRGIEEMEAAC